ncbi:hypothetical protein PI95_031870 [Hassallia byssoidea VB512170]|uniref:Uncharacterized protein n=1 Tax=Hassallia byssoidea VB512170 TaxID=1304833 RepID=A0A846HIV9_9CYAN|nr:hypothetical protein [Hassalia byssoidea]NEU76973.1 hypothetical protein [Hassalia byssoidea VB512170]
MKILPYDTWIISTSDSLPIVLQRLNAKVEPPKVFRFSTRHAPYQGTISEEGFRINRIIHYRNSFLPVIRGRFEVQSHQTLIHVQMSIHPFVMASLGFWYLVWFSTLVSITLTGSIPLHETTLHVGLPMLLLIIFLVAFWSEANRSRSELSQIIQGEV